jgi:hypothetical protein
VQVSGCSTPKDDTDKMVRVVEDRELHAAVDDPAVDSVPAAVRTYS